MPRRITVEVSGRQYPITADGQEGRTEALAAVEALLRSLVKDNTGTPIDELSIKIVEAEHLDPDLEITKIFTNKVLWETVSRGIVGHFWDLFVGLIHEHFREEITQVWQLAPLDRKWFSDRFTESAGVELLLSNFGLHLGMTREDLPPGIDKPWNQEPYFVPPVRKIEPTGNPNDVILFAPNELLDRLGCRKSVDSILETVYGLDRSIRPLPPGDFLWNRSDWQPPTEEEIVAAIGPNPRIPSLPDFVARHSCPIL